MTSAAFAQDVDLQKDEQLPLIEFGATVGTVSFPVYPGADEHKTLVGLLPAVIIRDRVLRSDEDDGVRAVVDDDPHHGFDIGFGGSWTVDSDDVAIRSGMPDLDYTFEIGPRFHHRLARLDKASLTLFVPVRAAFSTDFGSIRDRGFVAAPALRLRNEPREREGLRWTLQLTSEFATERWHDYFYSVAPEYATEGRPAYRAKGGYVRSVAGAGAGWRLGDYEVTLGGSFSLLDGAANTDSPLMVRKTNWAAGVGFTWWFYASDEPGYR